MVGISIECRLGNQLFQYAFIKALSKKLKTSFFVNEKMGEFIAPNYFDIKGYHPLINWMNRIYFKLKYGSLFHSLQSVAVGAYNDDSFAALADHTIYTGYFQSSLFFKNIDISSVIRVKKKYRKQFEEKYQHIFANNPVIAIHVRRGDYQNLNDWWMQNLGSNNLTLPADYYLHCLEKVNDLINYKIIFVSDDIEFVRSTFAHIENAEFLANDMITDFQLLMNADVCIISNSSFSWWAAYLNQKKSKKVFCPEYWLGFKIKKEYPDHIIPAYWEKVCI